MKPKNQRLLLIALATVALLGAALLAMWGLRERAAYFYTPSEILNTKGGQRARLGGMVEPGSVGTDGVITTFNVTDGQNSLVVSYRGILPNLFKEGSGVVAEGQLDRSHFGEVFVADTILAKHDERYMPPQLGNQAAEHKAGETVAR